MCVHARKNHSLIVINPDFNHSTINPGLTAGAQGKSLSLSEPQFPICNMAGSRLSKQHSSPNLQAFGSV